MIKAVVFDLDDTLISEEQYVKSGFKKVAKYISKVYNIDDDESYRYMIKLFEINKRNVFNCFLDHYKIKYDLRDIEQLIKIYRNHTPNICLYDDAIKAIEGLHRMNRKIGIISDGYLKVQQKKIKALNIENMIDYIILTDKIGKEFWKPHPKAFELMAEKLNVGFEEMVYVGDNPNKDFYIKSIYPITTIRIKRENSIYLNDKYYCDVKPDFEIKNLKEIKDIILKLNN